MRGHHVLHTDATSLHQLSEAVMSSAVRQVDMAKILVVDDYRDTVESMALWLKHFGHEVHVARDGIEAIEVARYQRPNYVLLDLGLPRLDGFQVATRLRQELAGPLVIIAITGYCQEHHRELALAAGCDHFLIKPISLVTLISLLPEILSDSSIQNGPRRQAIPHRAHFARREIEIINAQGLHLRAAYKFVTLAQEFEAQVVLNCAGQEASGKSILDLMTLAAECGSRIALKAEGIDAEAAVQALTSLVERRFDEDGDHLTRK